MKNAQPQVSRLSRVTSHALIDVKTNRWNPFSKLSAVLLDVTLMGFKIEFIENVSIAKNAELSFTVPLAPFEIYDHVALKLRGQVKWFDPNAMRAGGIFLPLTDSQEVLLNQVIGYLRAKEHSLHRALSTGALPRRPA